MLSLHLADESPPSFSFVPVAYKETGVKTNNQKGFSTFLFQSFGMAISFHYKIKSTFQWPEITFFPGHSSLLVPYTISTTDYSSAFDGYTTFLLHHLFTETWTFAQKDRGLKFDKLQFLVTWFHMVAVEQMGGGGVEVKIIQESASDFLSSLMTK